MFVLSCGLNVNSFYVKYLTQDSAKEKKKYFVKITHIFIDSARGSQTFKLSLSLSLYIYIYIYVYVCIHMYMCICMCNYNNIIFIHITV